jgi:hypothetical protein
VQTDYLVVGAGASGLAFADALVAADERAEVLLVDRRAVAGGHWIEAYPYVRLHQPSAYYGVASRPLGDEDVPLATGPEAGWYPRAGAAEVLVHLQGAMEALEATCQVRFLGGHEHLGGGRVASRLSGRVREVRVRRKVVDTTYFDTAVPATHTPGFGIDPGARVVPAGALASLDAPPERYVVLGSGKTAMDAVAFLLDRGVAEDRIRWVRPRDQWVGDRAHWQPLAHAAAAVEGLATDLEAVAGAASFGDLLHRLEDAGRLLRLDPRVEPTMYRCVIASHAELEQLRRVEDVVRLGRVRRVGTRSIELEHGTVATDARTLHVDATANGLAARAPRPVFAPGRITLGQVRACSPSFNAALIGHVEATRDDLEEQNRLCPVSAPPAVPASWLHNLVATLTTGLLWRDPDLRAWIDGCRLNLTRGLRRDDPRVQAASERARRQRDAVAAALPRLLAEVAR